MRVLQKYMIFLVSTVVSLILASLYISKVLKRLLLPQQDVAFIRLDVDSVKWAIFGHTYFSGLLTEPSEDTPIYHPLVFDHDPRHLMTSKARLLDRILEDIEERKGIELVQLDDFEMGAFMRFIRTKISGDFSVCLPFDDHLLGPLQIVHEGKGILKKMARIAELSLKAGMDPIKYHRGNAYLRPRDFHENRIIFSYNLVNLLDKITFKRFVSLAETAKKVYFECLVIENKKKNKTTGLPFLRSLATHEWTTGTQVLKEWKGRVTDLSGDAEYTLAYWLARIQGQRMRGQNELQQDKHYSDELQQQSQQKSWDELFLYFKELQQGLALGHISYLCLSNIQN